jgi:glycerol-3-phosphate dehydrogenase
MQRRPENLNEEVFDLVIVGGGIYGACAAWEAVTRGLSVALLEKRDFGWSTSANMHRILHGGFRYLRNADFKRIRESVRERNTMMRLAPHLTEPLPFLVPTEPSGIQHKEIMRIATTAYDVLSYGRNRGIEPSRHIPGGRIVSRDECLRLAPGLNPEGVTGGAIWYDGFLSDPARLCLEFIHSAVDRGVMAINYVKASAFLREGSRVTGVVAEDTLTGNSFDVRGKVVLNCTGPWSEQTVKCLGQDDCYRPPRYVRSVDVVTRPLTLENHGLALMGSQDGKSENTIRYFIAPWRGLSIIGSVDYMHDVDPDNFAVQPREIEYIIDVVNSAMPGAGLTRDDVLAVQAGLIPHDDTNPMDDPYNAARHYSIINHSDRDGIEGMFSVVGIKYTTARDIAEKTLDQIQTSLKHRRTPSVTSTTPLHGGGIDDFNDYLARATASRHDGFDKNLTRCLVHNYGSAYIEVMELIREHPEWGEPVVEGSTVCRAQVIYAVRHEMAVKLCDVVLRRTGLGVEGYPGRDAIEAVARLMAECLKWDKSRMEAEIDEVEFELNRFWVHPKSKGTQ